ncbi:MAG: hypothetical protein U9N08_00475 [Candidatus Caldatribacteriota bacterium]|nr:hypothetical protein [Candidatus Caldatribacteriota bacterium]
MRRMLHKKTLIFMLIVVMVFGFTSCAYIITPETGTVTISVEESFIMGKITITKNYYIYMDDVFKGMSIDLAPLTLVDIPVGYHTFKASDYSPAADSIDLKSNEKFQKKPQEKIMPFHCIGSILSEVTVGINYVNIPVVCTGIYEY